MPNNKKFTIRDMRPEFVLAAKRWREWSRLAVEFAELAGRPIPPISDTSQWLALAAQFDYRGDLDVLDLDALLPWCIGRLRATAPPPDAEAPSSASPRRLSETERKIVALVARKTLKGETIADRVGLEYSAYVRRLLAALVRDGVLTNDNSGYRKSM